MMIPIHLQQVLLAARRLPQGWAAARRQALRTALLAPTPPPGHHSWSTTVLQTAQAPAAQCQQRRVSCRM